LISSSFSFSSSSYIMAFAFALAQPIVAIVASKLVASKVLIFERRNIHVGFGFTFWSVFELMRTVFDPFWNGFFFFMLLTSIQKAGLHSTTVLV